MRIMRLKKDTFKLLSYSIVHGTTVDLPGGDSPLLWACYYGHILAPTSRSVEVRSWAFKTGQMVLLENGVVQYRVDDTKFPEEKSKLKYLHEVHVANSKGETDVFTIIR